MLTFVFKSNEETWQTGTHAGVPVSIFIQISGVLMGLNTNNGHSVSKLDYIFGY